MRFVVIGILCFTVACKPDTHSHGEEHAAVCSHSLTAEEYDDTQIVEQPGAKLGELARCPISGSVFRVSDVSPRTEQNGDTYYTCCGGCIDQLEKSFARRR